MTGFASGRAGGAETFVVLFRRRCMNAVTPSHECEQNIEDALWNALADIRDPCMSAAGLDLSVVDLGLITRVDVSDNLIEIGITFTSVGVPVHTPGYGRNLRCCASPCAGAPKPGNSRVAAGLD